MADEQTQGEAVEGEAVEASTDDTVSLSKAEVEALRRQAREGREAIKRVEREQAEAEEKRKKERGEFKELAEVRERERDEARAEATRIKQEALAERLAAAAKFHDPTDVLPKLRPEELESEEAMREGLERIARQSPHLVRQETAARPEIGVVHDAAQKGPNGDGPKDAEGRPSTLTVDQIQQMSTDQINARYDEVRAVLAASQAAA